ncbi:hypothetical protein ACIRG5_28415 [Lentzea sp. NPDC102401]|uniref:hypothetical protein n=1 Tax=Lentzea sp. NPDC102401 TaxID=3364128 RepID=UPI00381B58CA
MAFNRRLHLYLDKARVQTYPNFVVTFGMGHHTYLNRELASKAPPVEPDRSDRMVELNGVLWLLDAVQRGDLSAERMRKLLVDASAYLSDCCQVCDEIFDEWPKLDANQRAQLEQWERRSASLTAESHPYTLNATETKIHRWDCGTVSEAPPPVYPDRHTYAMRAMYPFDFDDYDSSRSARRITPAEATAWAAKRKRPPRCRTCAPILPTVTSSEASGVASTY